MRPVNADAHPSFGGGRVGIGNKDNGVCTSSTQSVSRSPAPRQELRAANGQVVAVGEGAELVKHIYGSLHFLRQPAGIAFDVDHLEKSEAAGRLRVVVTDRETGIVYRAPLAAFWQHGVRIDRGYGPQVALPFAYWQRQTPGAPVQLALFAEVQ